MNTSRLFLLVCGIFLTVSPLRALDDGPGRWPVEKANAWFDQHGWLRGANFLPSNAINQLEMWQFETFDPRTIDRELGWAEGLGFNSMRVFLHDLPYDKDPAGFERRVDQFLGIAEKHHIKILFAIFDSCWHPVPKLGPQPIPIPHTHNPGWVQSPGAAALRDPAQEARLHKYVTGIVKRFANDKRVIGWDVWNEPDNIDGGEVQRKGLEMSRADKAKYVNAMMTKAFAWAREANPSQPLTSGVWDHVENWGSDERLSECERIQLANSDVISFHNYAALDKQERKCVEDLRRFNRPMMQTEYMARPNGSTFDPVLGFLKEEKVAAYNWGFVSGKSQTIYPWDSWTTKYMGEPPLWFHDIFRPDGKPYKEDEVAYIRKVTGKAP